MCPGLQKCANSVMKVTVFFIAHDERGGNEQETKKDVSRGDKQKHVKFFN